MRFTDWLFSSESEPGGDWSTVHGVVYSPAVVLPSRNIYRAEVSYSYPAGDEYYSGFYKRLFLLESAADRFLAQFPKGRKITVHYRRNHPEVSSLFKQDMFQADMNEVDQHGTV
jgi:hypothetical protein